MNRLWPVAIPLAGFGAFFAWKRMAFVSEAVARQQLAQGALVIDVRSPAEYRSGHVPEAINLPLGELLERLPQRVQDKNQGLLVHCLSGGRSGIAQQQLKARGYPNVFNLGSLVRARQIVAGAKGQ